MVMLNLLGSHVACEKHLNNWHKVWEVVRHNIMSSVEDYQKVHNLDSLIDFNANVDQVCKGCKRPLGDDRMQGGDGIVGCDTLTWRWHDRCFFGTFGHLD